MSFTLLGILNSQAAGAGGAGAYDLLETTVLTSSASSVSFTGLGSYTDYKHLQIRATLRTDEGNFGLDDLRMRFNSDTGNNYAYHSLFGNGSAVDSTAGSSDTRIRIKEAIMRDAPSNIFGATVIDILDFASTNKNTTIRAFSGALTSAETAVSLSSGLYNNTAAITSALLTPEGPNFVTGCRFSLYGLKASA